MFKKRSDDNQSTFWISYADLMAGLLFVFILLIGAIVAKSMILREDLYAQQDKLGKTEIILMEKISTLKKSKRELEGTMGLLEQKKNEINQKVSLIASGKKTIIRQEEKIRLQAEDVRKLHLLLAELRSNTKKVDLENKALLTRVSEIGEDLNRTRVMLSEHKNLKQIQEGKIGQLEALITLTRDSLKLNQGELEKLNQLLLARNSKVDTLSKKIILLQNLTQDSNMTLQRKQKKLQEYVGRVIVLSNNLTDKEDELKLKDEKLSTLLDALDNKKTKYDDLVAKLQGQRAQIKSLTGIRLKVISALKSALGDKINIDKKSGALRLSSNILFDKGSSELKDESKEELRSAFEEYVGTLVSDEAIRPHLDRIVIEGHTDSDGTYIYNLRLSQERALAVMNYLLTLPIAQKYQLKKYLTASGRAYLDGVTRNGTEDKDASRRIEIKFQLRNQDAMHEIERILDDRRQLF
ncbi:MAG: OmpA family protein [Sulfurovum sp.]|nr:OmpA family protein [Sulfurovum sp.]